MEFSVDSKKMDFGYGSVVDRHGSEEQTKIEKIAKMREIRNKILVIGMQLDFLTSQTQTLGTKACIKQLSSEKERLSEILKSFI